MTFTDLLIARNVPVMRQAAAILCNDRASLDALNTVLEEFQIELIHCRSQEQALELVMDGKCSTLVVDFNLQGADEAIRMANLLPESQKPMLIAIAMRAWPGTGEAFQSGANRILYKPVEAEPLREALKSQRRLSNKNRRKFERFDVKTIVYLEIEGETVSAISIDIGEHGLALQAAEPVPMNSNVEFRCVLPGTDITLHGHADVIWASDHGRAGLFFSKLAPAARKHLTHWLHKRGHHARDKNTVRDLLPPPDAHVSFALANEEVSTEP